MAAPVAAATTSIPVSSRRSSASAAAGPASDRVGRDRDAGHGTREVLIRLDQRVQPCGRQPGLDGCHEGLLLDLGNVPVVRDLGDQFELTVRAISQQRRLRPHRCLMQMPALAWTQFRLEHLLDQRTGKRSSRATQCGSTR